jgi:hypothetical protein
MLAIIKPPVMNTIDVIITLNPTVFPSISKV